MRPIAMKLVAETTTLAPDHKRPVPIREVTLRELCEAARIPCRVTAEGSRRILLHGGLDHHRSPNAYFVGGVRGVHGSGAMGRVAALRALEVLAYSFMDYGARESVCGRGLFVAREPPGRRSRLGRPRTAAERMRAMRARRRA